METYTNHQQEQAKRFLHYFLAAVLDPEGETIDETIEQWAKVLISTPVRTRLEI